ncbi:thiolase family protein [Caballeronia grimmiae]|uniref:Acetyl-CoA acetyltransferase n=1 Tax=Caballeronia grimmiae TaxID=1071679 RepID=A0A069NPT4_9BURK|nr:thiolase family protein [Caballeronia grimmiae]KDR27051.1 acetyl-CoA acetyltransferase [Caballeronia grimmiae]GGD89438.1 acetyl-CoA acetyltransferase [Caballeronia grimmiae]
MTTREIILAHPVRTAIGAFNGALKGVPATELGAHVIRESLRRGALDGGLLGAVVMGNVIQAGNRMNPARQAAIGGGVPVSVPALTVNRVCGSGAQAVLTAAAEILAGDYDVAVAGGMENMDRTPYLLDGGRWGYRMGPGQVLDSMLADGLNDAFSGQHSGWHTEDLVAQAGITRAEQDAFAARSQQRFAAAQKEGRFAGQIVPVDINGRKGTERFETDEAPRPDTTAENLARLRPAFRPEGTITAGNSPGLNSGAAAMIVADRAFVDARGLEPLGRLAGYGVAAVEPGLFGLGPVPAVHKALARAGWTLGDIERIEINEAFAVVPIAVARELGLPIDLVNVDGGAVAHGHPIGATGAILVTKLLHAMRQDGLKRGVVTLCIGGGQGIALALEAL